MIENSRQKYIPVVKETFENPQLAFIDEMSDLMLTRKISDRLFFVNISRDYGDKFLNVTLSPKGDNTLLHKLDKAQQIIIDKISSELLDSSAHKASTGFLSSTSKDTMVTTKSLTKEQSIDKAPKEAQKESQEVAENKILSYATQDKKPVKELRINLKQGLDGIVGKMLVNEKLNISGMITNAEVKKISSTKAIQKSVDNGFSIDEHFTVANDIEKLFKTATKSEIHNDYKQNPNILKVHRISQDISINDKEAVVKALFEKKEGNNKIYTIELESLEKPSPNNPMPKGQDEAVKAQYADAGLTPAPIAKTDNDIIAQIQSKLQEANKRLESGESGINQSKKSENIEKETKE